MSQIIDWIVAHKALELGVLFAISEGLALIPQVKANSVFQLVFGWLAKNKG